MKDKELGFHLLIELLELILNDLNILLDDRVPINVCMRSYDKLIPFAKAWLKASNYRRLSKLYPIDFFLVNLVSVVIFTWLHKENLHALVELLMDDIAFIEHS